MWFVLFCFDSFCFPVSIPSENSGGSVSFIISFFSSVSSFYYLLLLLSTKPYYWCVRACVRACVHMLDYLCLHSLHTSFFFFLHGFELIYVFNHLPFWWLCQVLCVESLLVPHSITFSFRYIVFIQLLSVIFFSSFFSRTVNVIGK